MSKCALREKKEEGSGFPETSQPFSIVSCQLSPQVLFQIIKSYRLYFRQHFFQYSALLNEPPCPGFSFLRPVPCLCFFQSVLRLQQLLFCIRHAPSPLFLPDNFIAQRIGKLDSLDVAQGFPLELV